MVEFKIMWNITRYKKAQTAQKGPWGDFNIGG
jgi:hypothetical protein